MTTKSGVFISYARKDGEQFADSLRARLAAQAPDIRVWQDRPELEGGVGWWRQIEAALDRVEFLVIVMTGAALESEVTRKEWHAARQAGVCVYPVKGPGFDFDDPRLPRWMKKAQVYDLDVQWETFVAHLRRGCQATRVPFMAPPPPADFVARRREFAALKELLLNPSSGDAIAITTALTGAGGFGKTTLAAALCHSDEIVSAFDDGILWTTLGQTPHLQNELTTLYAGLTGERPGFVSVEDAAQALAGKLETKNCLIVIDDVWEPAHLKPFLRGGPECARLITTRQAAVAAEARRVSVDEMTSLEAMALLLARIQTPPTNLEPIRRLAARLGEWPLLLKLAGGAMRSRLDRGDTVSGAVEHINRALGRRGITAFDRERASERNEAVASTVDLSLELLDDADRRRCIELAIFPEDVAVPVGVVAELWGLDRDDAEETLVRLDNASLVEFDLRTGTIGLHDVMRAYLGERLKRTVTTAAAHARLLAAWPEVRRLPHEYAWRWIGYHLHEAGQAPALADLLLDLDWLARKLQATDIYSLVSDFRYAAMDGRLELLRHWLRLSSHVLARDKAQFGPQLLARVPDPQGELREQLIHQLKSERRRWLRPLWPSLSGPGGSLIRTLDAQGVAVNDLAITSGGQIVSTGSDGSLQVWDFDTGSLLRSLAPDSADSSELSLHSRSAGVRVALLPDGRILVGARNLSIWDWQHAPEPEELIRVSVAVSALTVSADGERALVGSRTGALRLYDLGRKEMLFELRGHRLSIEAVAITPDGRRAVSGGYDKSVKLWDLTTGELIDSLYPPHEGVVYAVAISPDGAFAVSGSGDRRLRIWDLGTGTLRRELTGHAHRVYAVAISADGTRAISGSHDRTLKLWDLASGQVLRTFEGHADAVGAVAFTPDDRYAVSAADDLTLKIWQLDATHARASTQQHQGWIHALVMTQDGQFVFTAGQDHVVRVWDVPLGRVVKVLEGHHDTVCALAVSGTGSTLVSGSFDRTLIVWDVSTAQRIHTLQGHADAVAAVGLVSNGTRALSGSLDGVAWLWNLERGRPVRRWDAHRRGIAFVATSMDGRLAVTGSSDGTLKIWEVDTGSCVCTLNAHHGGVTAGALVFKDTLLLSGGADGTVRLWRFPSGEMLRAVAVHTGKVRALAVLSGGKLAASGGYDRHVRVWTLEEGEQVAAFATDSPVIALACSPDSPTIVAGDAQGSVHFLRLENNV